MKDLTAGGQHHWPMPLQKADQRCFVPVLREAAQEGAIAQAGGA
jgi:hypothetical protein